MSRAATDKEIGCDAVPTEIRLPSDLKADRWKLKIRDKEAREPPHVTILRRTDAWRINLRTHGFMDDHPRPDEVPEKLMTFVEENWQSICDKWNEKYPGNPVEGDEE